jgi:CheY-like chemotaxis protein
MMDGFKFLDELRSQPDPEDIPVVIITAKDLTQEDRDRLNGGVERVIQKTDRDEMLRQLSREIAKCVKRQTAARLILSHNRCKGRQAGNRKDFLPVMFLHHVSER